jgi:3-hexulose-6-phosphate synthase
MKLQLALDRVDVAGAVAIVENVKDLIDIVEIGTPMIIRLGVGAVAEVKSAFPKIDILADLKIMDAGGLEAEIAFEAGADIVTVLAAAHDETVRGVIQCAESGDRKVMVDTIAVPDVVTRAREVDAMGADFVCIHTATDLEGSGREALSNFGGVAGRLEQAKPAVAGGINPDSLERIVEYNPEVVIVGSYITADPDPRRAASEIREVFG